MAGHDDLTILLIDDSENDTVLIRRALHDAGVLNPLRTVCDGEEAIAYLQGTGAYSDRQRFPLPDLILLDLKMPKIDGFDVLQWIRQQPALKGLPVIALSGSENTLDVNRSYELGANSFLVKPFDFRLYPELMRGFQQFWFGYGKVPSHGDRVPAGRSEGIRKMQAVEKRN